MTQLRVAFQNFAKVITRGEERPEKKEVKKEKEKQLSEGRTKKTKEEGGKNKMEVILRE
jgi:hypothetical protein